MTFATIVSWRALHSTVHTLHCLMSSFTEWIFCWDTRGSYPSNVIASLSEAIHFSTMLSFSAQNTRVSLPGWVSWNTRPADTPSYSSKFFCKNKNHQLAISKIIKYVWVGKYYEAKNNHQWDILKVITEVRLSWKILWKQEKSNVRLTRAPALVPELAACP